jgi:Transposase IS116/IS110/IS902 family
MRQEESQVPKANVLKKVRNHTDEHVALLNAVHHYLTFQKMRISDVLRYKSMERRDYIDKDTLKQFLKEQIGPMKRTENSIINAAAKQLKGMPVWDGWMSNIRGVGPVIGVQLVAMIQPVTDFETISRLWAYAGYACDENGEAVKRKVGQQSRWNPSLKTAVHKLADCFIKTRSPYREFYEAYKAEDRIKHPEPVKTDRKDRTGKAIRIYTDGHIHNRAMRYMSKMFLSHLWLAWRELEGHDVPTNPYVIDSGKHPLHTHLIGPWDVVSPPKLAPRPKLRAAHGDLRETAKQMGKRGENRKSA